MWGRREEGEEMQGDGRRIEKARRQEKLLNH